MESGGVAATYLLQRETPRSGVTHWGARIQPWAISSASLLGIPLRAQESTMGHFLGWSGHPLCQAEAGG
jgi:hypothetical protein